MNLFFKLSALAALLLGLVLPVGVAGAQTYPNPDTPDNPPTDVPTDNEQPDGDVDGEGGEVDGEDDGEEPTGGGDVGGPGEGEEQPTDDGAVMPEDAAGVGAETAPSGSLPITGGDVFGMVLMGGAALAIGGAMVLRSRRMRSTTA